MPISSAISAEGSSPATCVTKSQRPAGATAATMPAESSRILGSRRVTWRGVKPRFTRFRSLVCAGGSMFSSIMRFIMRPTGSMSGVMTPPSHEENVAWSRDTETTSAWRESSQNPGPSRSASQHTGASARSRRNASWGGPSRKVSGSRRSRSMTRP